MRITWIEIENLASNVTSDFNLKILIRDQVCLVLYTTVRYVLGDDISRLISSLLIITSVRNTSMYVKMQILYLFISPGCIDYLSGSS